MHRLLMRTRTGLSVFYSVHEPTPREIFVTQPTYVFDNAWKQGRARLDAVESLLDPGSERYLAALGVTQGWTCLEVGAGGGSVAAWLRDRVGPDGRVVSTDLDTRYFDALAVTTLEVRTHDIVKDDLETVTFDLVHARLVLEHVAERDLALQKMARSLKPGGWLVLESVDYVSGVPVSALGATDHERSQSVRLQEFRKVGLDDTLGRRLPGTLRAVGLTDVGNEGRVWVMEGGSACADWFRLSMEQVRARLVGPDKLTDAEVDRMLGAVRRPRVVGTFANHHDCLGSKPEH